MCRWDITGKKQNEKAFIIQYDVPDGTHDAGAEQQWGICRPWATEWHIVEIFK